MLFGKPAESEYIITIAKGTQVFVEGQLQHRRFQKTVGKEKVEWPVTEIVVSFLKKQGGEDRGVRSAGEWIRVLRRNHG